MLKVIWGGLAFIAGWLLGAQRERTRETRAATQVRDELAKQVDRAGEIVESMARLADELEWLHEAAETWRSLPAELGAARETAQTLRESVAALDKQLGRIGREQFKINTLSETQQQQIQAALEQLRELSARREADLEMLREQLRADQSAQRLNVIQQLLPALDGLDEALAAGRRLLARASEWTGSAPPTLTFQQRMAIAIGLREPIVRADGTENWRQAVEGWLMGIELVRERLLRVLAAEGVQPIRAQGERFDPHIHIAVEAVPAPEGVAPGTVVQEFRRGYRVGERILRAPEVVVAKGETSEEVKGESVNG